MEDLVGRESEDRQSPQQAGIASRLPL